MQHSLNSLIDLIASILHQKRYEFQMTNWKIVLPRSRLKNEKHWNWRFPVFVHIMKNNCLKIIVGEKKMALN